MLTVVEPTVVHEVPFDELYAVMTLPKRTSLSQYGAFGPLTDVLVLPPLVLVRRMNRKPPPGVTKTPACFDPAARLSRNMMPALASRSVFCKDATRTTMVASPVICR